MFVVFLLFDMDAYPHSVVPCTPLRFEIHFCTFHIRARKRIYLKLLRAMFLFVHEGLFQ